MPIILATLVGPLLCCALVGQEPAGKPEATPLVFKGRYLGLDFRTTNQFRRKPDPSQCHLSYQFLVLEAYTPTPLLVSEAGAVARLRIDGTLDLESTTPQNFMAAIRALEPQGIQPGMVVVVEGVHRVKAGDPANSGRFFIKAVPFSKIAQEDSLAEQAEAIDRQRQKHHELRLGAMIAGFRRDAEELRVLQATADQDVVAKKRQQTLTVIDKAMQEAAEHQVPEEITEQLNALRSEITGHRGSTPSSAIDKQDKADAATPHPTAIGMLGDIQVAVRRAELRSSPKQSSRRSRSGRNPLRGGSFKRLEITIAVTNTGTTAVQYTTWRRRVGHSKVDAAVLEDHLGKEHKMLHYSGYAGPAGAIQSARISAGASIEDTLAFLHPAEVPDYFDLSLSGPNIGQQGTVTIRIPAEAIAVMED